MNTARPISRIVLLSIGFLVTVVVHAESASVQAGGSLLEDAMLELGFDLAQRADLEAGGVLSVGLDDIERHPNELTVGAAMMLVRRPLDVVAEALVDDSSFRVNSDVLDYRLIGDGSENREGIREIFREVVYAEKESAEVAKLLQVTPGTVFNLSSLEMEEFRSIEAATDNTRESVSAKMAELLRERFLAYLDNGLESVEPYARSDRETASPQRELSVAFSAMEFVKEHFTTFHESLLRFPEPLSNDTVSRFYWAKRKASGRPVYLLAHRMEQHDSDYAIGAELHFYVGHSYNSMLTLIGCFPTDSGTVVLSVNRLFTDQVTGLGSRLKKRVGRKQIGKALAEHFRALRDELEKPTPGQQGG